MQGIGRGHLRSALLAGGIGVALALSACGSDDSDSASTPAATGGSTASSPSSADSAAALAELRKGNETAPPSSSPPPARGKSIIYVSCGQALPGCSIPVAAAQEAAKALGWNFKVADGKLGAGGAYATAIRTAIAAKPDVIAVQAVDCASIRQPLQEANDAGIKTLAVESTKCPEGGPEYDEYYQFTDDMKLPEDFFYQQGEAAAKYIIAATGGKAKTILNSQNQPLGKALAAGFKSVYETCSECTIVDEIEFGNDELTPNGPWISAFRSATIKEDANAAFVPFGVMISGLGGGKAVKESGKEMVVVGGNGESDATDPIRQGLSTACPSCHDTSWMGYGAMDAANRMVQNQPVVPSGEGIRAVDEENLTDVSPKEGDPYASPIDWKSAYLKAWGVDN